MIKKFSYIFKFFFFKVSSLATLNLCFSISKESNQFVHIRLSACLPSFTSNAQKCSYVCDEKRSKNKWLHIVPRAHISTRRKFDLPSRNAWKLKNCSFFSLTDKMIDSILLVSLCFILSLAAWKLRFFPSHVGDQRASNVHQHIDFFSVVFSSAIFQSRF